MSYERVDRRLSVCFSGTMMEEFTQLASVWSCTVGEVIRRLCQHRLDELAKEISVPEGVEELLLGVGVEAG